MVWSNGRTSPGHADSPSPAPFPHQPHTPTRVAQSLNIHFKLEKGKYVRTHHRLDVQPTGRFLVNLALESAMARATFVKPWDTGLQD
jgi:hypothetical protein